MAENSKMSLHEAMDATSDRIKEVRIMEGEDTENSSSVVCATVEEIPIPPCKSVIENCSKCDKRIWVAHTSPKNPPRICYHCYVDLVQALEKGEGVEVGIHGAVARKIIKRKLS